MWRGVCFEMSTRRAAWGERWGACAPRIRACAPKPSRRVPIAKPHAHPQPESIPSGTTPERRSTFVKLCAVWTAISTATTMLGAGWSEGRLGMGCSMAAP